MTVTEMGATAGFSESSKIIYDVFSGAYSDTIITSEYGLSGYLIHAYYNDLVGVPYYENNLNPYDF